MQGAISEVKNIHVQTFSTALAVEELLQNDVCVAGSRCTNQRAAVPQDSLPAAPAPRDL